MQTEGEEEDGGKISFWVDGGEKRVVSSRSGEKALGKDEGKCFWVDAGAKEGDESVTGERGWPGRGEKMVVSGGVERALRKVGGGKWWGKSFGVDGKRKRGGEREGAESSREKKVGK